MAGDSSEMNFIIAFAFVCVFLIALNFLGLPAEYQIMSNFDFAWFAGGMIAVAAACTVTTGLACVLGGAIWSTSTLLTYVGIAFFTGSPGTSLEIVKAFIFTPLTIGLTYLEARLVRGGG